MVEHGIVLNLVINGLINLVHPCVLLFLRSMFHAASGMLRVLPPMRFSRVAAS